MKIVHNRSGQYPDALNNYYFYDQFDDDSNQSVLFQGYETSRDERLKSAYRRFKRKAYINLQAPTAFASALDAVSSQQYFDQVYTICPYTAQWLNKAKKRYYPISFPINIDYLQKNVPNVDKTIDVMYQGNVTCAQQNRIIDVMSSYSHVFTSMSTHPKVTHLNITTVRKWGKLKRSKCNVIINACPISRQHVGYITKYQNWKQNRAFSDLGSGWLPQFKSRVVQAAACKCINLIKRDRWDVMQFWFQKDKQFLYWDTIRQLKSLISDIKNNYFNYTHIVQNAYNKVKQYDSEVVFKNILMETYL